VFPDDPAFFNPPRMLEALQGVLSRQGHETPEEPAGFARVILDSLALRYASVIATIERLTASAIPGIHVVGGGSLNDYLNQATADASGRPVLAGPVEATAAGNLVIQAIAAGSVASLTEARERVATSAALRAFEPRPSAAWDEARARYAEVERTGQA
jgi:rhamnulokinase